MLSPRTAWPASLNIPGSAIVTGVVIRRRLPWWWSATPRSAAGAGPAGGSAKPAASGTPPSWPRPRPWQPTRSSSSMTKLPIGRRKLPDDLKLGRHGIYSPAHGSLEFITPVIEEPLEWASQDEANAYNQWRSQYEQQWQKFDPIALRLEIDPQHVAADLTITPLTLRTEYSQVRSAVQGASIPRGAGDPHDALLQVVLAINENSMKTLRGLAEFAYAMHGRGNSPGNILDWFAGSASIWIDEDRSLRELAKQFDGERRKGTNTDWRLAPIALQLPVGARVEVTSGLKLTKFLLGLRTFIEETSPGMFRWELRTYREQPYTKVSLGELPGTIFPRGTAIWPSRPSRWHSTTRPPVTPWYWPCGRTCSGTRSTAASSPTPR